MNFKDVEKKYKEQQRTRKEEINRESNKFIRLLKMLWMWVSFPFIWIFYNIRDWHTAIIFVICFAILSSEIWIPYLIGLLTIGTSFSKWCFGFASACWMFWLGPGTPFLVIVIGVTIGVKALLNKFRK